MLIKKDFHQSILKYILRLHIEVGPFLIIFAIVIPTLNGTIGVTIATYLGLSIGGAVMFGTLMASASFIAAPAI